MAMVEFYFKPQNEWTMGPACGNPSKNPAPATTGCIYIIHNSTENTTYIGYADDALHRWNTRTEVLHIMGIPQVYGQKILCAWCCPTYTGNVPILLQGQNAAEHLLIRGVANGLLGKTTNTNTQLAVTPFKNSKFDHMRVYLPSDPWGCLKGRREATW